MVLRAGPHSLPEPIAVEELALFDQLHFLDYKNGFYWVDSRMIEYLLYKYPNFGR